MEIINTELISLIIAAIALVLSSYSIFKTVRFGTNQDKLNKKLLDKEERAVVDEKKARLSANTVKIGKSYKLRIFNKGKATAKNINVSFSEGNELIIESEIQDKFPLSQLEEHQSVDLILAVHMGSPRKLALSLSWDDDYQESNKKVINITI